VRALLEAFVRDGIGQPTYKGELLTQVDMHDGAKITFEHGGAIEYCSPVIPNLIELIVTMQKSLRRLAETASTLNLALVPGGIFPFNTVENANWMPKPYGKFMRQHFTALGDAGSGGEQIMAHTISTQTTLDYTSEEDFICKLRTAVSLTPIAVALFANSPLEDGEFSASLSRRTEHWFKTDSRRSGLIPSALKEEVTIDDYIDWALNNEVIFYATDGEYKSGEGRTFAEVLAEGFPDGRYPTLVDWRNHLCQLWPDVRSRETIELRAPDGPPFEAIPAVPAFWVGILYHRPSCDSVWQLLKDITIEEHQLARADAARRGLSAQYGGKQIADLAKEVIRLAEEGLQHRINLGLEDPKILEYLQPLKTIIATGKTFAESCIENWNGSLVRSPARFVETYRIK
jgi:glutamate--cysteine ligase